MKLQADFFLYRKGSEVNVLKLLLGVIVILLILIAFYLRQSGYISQEGIFSFLERDRILSPLIFILLYAIMPSLFLPTLPLSIGSGFLWGPILGVVFSIIGATLGACLPFLIARYIVGRQLLLGARFLPWKWVLEQVDKNSWKVVAFTRLNPIFPSNILSYLFGLTSISFVRYAWSTCLFMIPLNILFVSLGSAFGSFVRFGDMQGVMICMAIALVTLILLFGLKPIFAKIYKKG